MSAWVPKVGQRVQLSREGWQDGFVRTPEEVSAARDMVITGVEQMGPGVWAIDVDGPLGIYMLHNMNLELKP